MITAITVVYNTPTLAKAAIRSVKKFYPELPIVMVNSSTDGHVYKFNSPFTLYPLEKNIGHGPGLHFALQRTDTEYALIFDSDIQIMKPGIIESMVKQIRRKPELYGIGEVVDVDDNGRNLDAKGIKYLHPYFALINVKEYFKYPPFINHGSPWIRTMKHLSENKLSNKIVKFNVPFYVFHHWRGTRAMNPRGWTKNWDEV